MTFPTDVESRPPASTVRSWIPRSWAAFGVFLLLAAAMAFPVLMACFMVVVYSSDCFLTACTGPQPAGAVAAAALSLIFALVPFAGVRCYQGGWPASASARLAILIVLLLIVGYTGRIIGLLP